MLFSSFEFIFLFLPIVVTCFYLVNRKSPELAITWLVITSLFFYAWWNAIYLVLILASIVLNYLIGRELTKRQGNKWLLTTGVGINLGLLGYYKYYNFFIANLNLLGLDISNQNIVLPLAISFFTFQQIAYLVDCYRAETREYSFSHYCLFISFFPQLIAGPIVHHKDILPQFSSLRFRFDNLSIGLAIFAIGLFKKVVLADNVSAYSDPVFAAVDAGHDVSFFEAWGGALGYTCQLYFDFSGYADMAIGSGRMLGIKLPLNFNSPYKSHNIIEFWRRWHMTLSTFLRDYLYIALGGNRRGPVRRHINLMITMLLGGLWHGAGWNFLIWGGLHGLFLVINHLWAQLKFAPFHFASGFPLGKLFAIGLTFLLVVIAWVFFRAETLSGAWHMLEAMAGLHGAVLPEQLQHYLPFLNAGVVFDGNSLGYFGELRGWLWIAGCLFVAWFLPNTQEIMNQFEPAYDYRFKHWIRYQFSQLGIKEGVLIGVILAVAFSQLTGDNEFLYFNF